MKTPHDNESRVLTRLGGSRATHLALLLGLALLIPTGLPSAFALHPDDPATEAPSDAHQLPSIPGLTDPPWRAWHTQTVKSQTDYTHPDSWDWDGLSAGDISIETGPNNQPHLLFGWRPPNDVADILYAEPVGDGQWDFDQIDHKASPGDLALDATGQPWVGWLSWGESFIATRNDTTSDWWTMNPSDDGRDVQIDVDNQGTIHIIQADVNSRPDPIEHGTFDPNNPQNGWSWTSIGGDELADPDLALDSQNTPHVVWAGTNLKIYYATNTPNGWTIEHLDDCSWEPDIAIGPTDTVHVACYSDNNPTGILHLVRQPDDTWQVDLASDGSQLTPPRTPDELDNSIDIETDDTGRPHITYRTNFNPAAPDDPTTPARPIYAVKANSGPCPSPLEDSIRDPPLLRWRPHNPCTDWHVQTVDYDGSWAGFYTDLALDDDGVPAIAYEYASRTVNRGCHDISNPCRDIRLATPLVDRLGLT